MRKLVLSVTMLVGAGQAAMAGESPMKAVYPRCEYRVNPYGINQKEPRLSWMLESGERGQEQTAYQVLVAADEEGLKRDQGDLWDSGKVASDETTVVVYAGKPLTPC
jgi:alpha-L-rhamnosidase